MTPQMGVYTKQDADADIAAHAADLDAHIAHLVRRPLVGQYWCGIPVHSVTTAGVGAGAMHASLIYVPRTMTFDQIAIEVTVAMAAGKKANLSLYDMDYTNWKPINLVLDAGAVLCDTTGVKSITINKQLTKGIYWGVLDPEDSVTYRSWNQALALMGYQDNLFQRINDSYYATHVYGAAPATFPTAGAGYYYQRAAAVQLRLASLD